MHLNKVNLSWVISDGRKGHEIQSLTLAKKMSKQVFVHSFELKQPWATFAPRLFPGFGASINWTNNSQPAMNQCPDLIISTGRKAAAVGKWLKRKLFNKEKKITQWQILNPKDSPENYDLLFIPKHDQITGDNIINYTGSIHPFDQKWHQQQTSNNENKFNIALIIGNPPDSYFKTDFVRELNQIRLIYPNQNILFCGSPRLSHQHHIIIRSLLSERDICWLKKTDGKNPYQQILQSCQHMFVTADSINMVNECASSRAQVSLLAKSHITSKKHQHFFESINHRLTGFNQSLNQPEQLTQTPLTHPLDEILQDPRFQIFLKSPNSSNFG